MIVIPALALLSQTHARTHNNFCTKWVTQALTQYGGKLLKAICGNSVLW